MGWTFLTNQTNILSLITADGSWRDVDLSTVVPAGTTGAILQVHNYTGTVFALTRGGSGEADRSAYSYINGGRHHFLFAKLDANRKFSGFFNGAGLLAYLVAYTNDDSSHFFAASTDKSLGSTGSYVDIDCSAVCPDGAAAAILEICNVHATSGRYHALRKNGSAFDVYNYQSAGRARLGILPLDASRIGEGKISSAELDWYVWGYVADGWTFFDTPKDVSPGASTTWTDCSHADVPAGSKVVALLLVNTSGSNRTVNIRKKGSSDNVTANVVIVAGNQMNAMVGLDDDGYFQAYVSEHATAKVYILGYFLDSVSVNMDPAYVSLTVSGKGYISV